MIGRVRGIAVLVAVSFLVTVGAVLTPAARACSTTSNIEVDMVYYASNGTKVTIEFVNEGSQTESAWVIVDFDTETHGISDFAFQIVDLPAGWTEIVDIEFYEPFTLLGYSICPDDPAIGDAPDPIDIGHEREDENGTKQ